jgi:lipopolysaccharide/colanic/teichoic acid biosynthesis glycosyltransferase
VTEGHQRMRSSTGVGSVSGPQRRTSRDAFRRNGALNVSLSGDVGELAAKLTALEDVLAEPPAPEPRLARFVRRLFDVVVSGTALVLLSPVILLAATIVRLDSRGPGFFRQIRVGRGGAPFYILKLRGMYVDAKERFPDLYDYRFSTEEARTLHFHAPDDPRVTRAGRLFRVTSIDEFPNFWNVLVGEMSLVGPRPQIPEMFQYYGPHEKVILSVRPGIFSLPKAWLRDQLPLHETVLLDSYYVHSRTLLLDLKIVVRGVFTVLLRRGVH